MHVASGAAAGAALRSRARALALGPLLHFAADATPHEDIHSLRFELGTGIVLVVALAVRRGPLHPAVLGALAAASPDVEHVVRLPRPGGRKLFPTHRGRGRHRVGAGVPSWLQLVAAGVIVGVLLSPRKEI